MSSGLKSLNRFVPLSSTYRLSWKSAVWGSGLGTRKQGVRLVQLAARPPFPFRGRFAIGSTAAMCGTQWGGEEGGGGAHRGAGLTRTPPCCVPSRGCRCSARGAPSRPACRGRAEVVRTRHPIRRFPGKVRPGGSCTHSSEAVPLIFSF